jgi:hypothetical protein
MKLKKTTFEHLTNEAECLFKTDTGVVVHARKSQPGLMVNKAIGLQSFTGHYHEVWEIDPKEENSPGRRSSIAHPAGNSAMVPEE